jgi:outer membrane protein OmpA-like peptidoglycan-associated protein
MSRRCLSILASILILAPAVASSAAAAEVQLTALTLQSGRAVDVNFSRTSRAPARASMQASLLFDSGRTTIRLNFSRMEPAILFAGDISAYVLWAVTIDGTAENLGEVVVDRKNASGSQQYSTVKRAFALMVTAEPFAPVPRPTDVVLFRSGEVRTGNIPNTPFAFKNFQPGAKPALESIANIQYNDKTPAAVTQARKAIEIAERMNAAEVNPRAVEGAKAAFARALASGSNRTQMADQARAAAQLAAQAIKDKIKADEAREAAEAEAQRQAELAALEDRATTAETESQRIAQQLKEVERQRQALAGETATLAQLTEKLAAERDAIAVERDQVAADREAIKKERDELAGMLKGALSTVAETTETARGVIVSLSGILFDIGQATLKPASQVSVAKLAGILMVFPGMNLSIEGYTDSTGTLETNMRLSTERARAVYEFLLGQGIAASRMKYQGFGPENPVAPNDTEFNRAKNRRVEVVLTQAAKRP